MVKCFNIKEAIHPVGEFSHRLICPDCADHVQEECSPNDCVNIFVDDGGNVKGQCCCYNKKHF